MKYYKFKKDQDQYKKDEVLAVAKENKLLAQWIKAEIIGATTKPKEKEEK